MTEKIDSFDSRINDLENRVQLAENHCEDLHRGTEFIEIKYENLKEEMNYLKNNMVSKEEFRKLKQEMIDMSNRMRRQNLVFYNVPEGSEGESCTGFITDLARKVNSDIVIETAHRSPTYDANAANRTNPRPIHALCLKRDDKDAILEKGPKVYRKDENKINGKQVLSDDVHPVTISNLWKNRRNFRKEAG